MIKQLMFRGSLFAAGLCGILQGDQEVPNIRISSPDEAIVHPFASSHKEIVSVKMMVENTNIQPGEPFWVCFEFDIAPDWHLYWKNPGSWGQAPAIHWKLPLGFHTSELLWPTPERIEMDKMVIFGYSKQLTLLCQVFPPQNLQEGTKVDLKAAVRWLGCKKECVSGQDSFKITLDVSKTKKAASEKVTSLFKQARKALPSDTGKIVAKVSNGLLEIRVTQDTPFRNVQTVLFFPEQSGLFDAHLYPSWSLSDDDHTLVVRTFNEGFTGPQVNFPLKGVLVLEKQGEGKQSWNIRIANPVNPSHRGLFFDENF